MESEFVKEVEQLVDVAVLGQQVDAFMSSDVGRYLVGRIEETERAGYLALRGVSPADTEAVRAAQNLVLVADEMREWLVRAIQDGLRATQILESREDD